jgi:mannose-6-phosphate isomerase-like protein (cupin superfamily)
MSEVINLEEKFAGFSDHWRPRSIAELNGQQVRLVKVKGEFPWHHHEDEDEFFLVWKGKFRIEFRDRVHVLNAGECLLVARGIEHRTAADHEAEILIFEPRAVRNTGNIVDQKFTAPDIPSV